MPATILAQAVSGVRIAVEAAWGADLTDTDGTSWTWSDITDDVLMSTGRATAGDITITIGRQDENTQTNPSHMTCTLDNRSGRYSLGGMSDLWPNVRRGVPVRVRVSTNSGTTWTVKFQGFAASWQPTWDKVGKWATVRLTCAGPLRQINQGTPLATSYYSQVIPTSPLYPNLMYYWNNENGNGYEGPNQITLCYPTVPAGITSGSAVMSPITDARFFPQTSPAANSSAFPVAGPLPSAWYFTTGAAGLPATPSTGKLQFRWMAALTQVPSDANASLLLLRWRTSGNSNLWWALWWHIDGGLHVSNGPSLGSETWEGITYMYGAENRAVLFQLQHTTNGSQSTVRVDMMSPDGTWTGIAWNAPSGGTVGYLTGVQWCGPNINSAETPVIVAHMTVQNQTQSMGTLSNFYQGGAGENVLDRLSRLCSSAGIAYEQRTSTIADTSTAPIDSMGGQYFDTLTSLLRECEATGQGILTDGLGPGLTYITRQGRSSNPAALTLDADAGDLAVAFEPIDDDQNVINEMQVSRRNGATFTATDTTSELQAKNIGVFSNSASINPDSEAQLPGMAQWLMHLGQLPGYRYPRIHLELSEIASRIGNWCQVIPGSRIDIVNIDKIRAQLAPATIRQVVEGWTESINAYTWQVSINCSPWEPWNVGLLAAATGSTGDSVMRRDTDGSAVNTAAAKGATSVSVKLTAAGKPLWTTAADDFPMVVEMGGVPVTVTAISGAASPQTFTVPAGIPKALAVNNTVRLWNPPILAL